MDWLLKHPILIFVIVMVVSSFLKKLKSPEDTTSSSDGRQSQDASDDGERTRRLQEEIRRKIAERRGQLVPPSVPVSESATSVWDEKEEEPWSYRKEESPAVEEAPAIDPVLERQRALAEQLAALQLRHATVSKASQAAWAPELPVTAPASTNFEETTWLRELRSARSLRKAIILREVIGPPVALR